MGKKQDPNKPPKEKKSLGCLISDGIKKLKELFRFVIGHWNKPPEGKSLSFKEMAAYCVGGMGVSAATVLPTYLTLSVGLYIAAALNFDAASIAIVGVVTSIFTIIKSPFLGMLIDNTKSKYGKFRPYLIWMPIPSVICIILIGWVPYYIGQSNTVAMVVVFTILYNLMQVFIGLYTIAFNSLIQVISPSPEERTGLMSVGSFVYSLGPSIVSFLLPLVSMIFAYTDAAGVEHSGLNEIGTYQWIIPIMAIVFFSFGYWTAFGTKERVVVSKKYVQKVKFFEGIKQTFTNRYFYLTVASTALGVFRLLCTSFTAWICIYMIQKDVALSVANVLMGMAYVPGMLLAPLFIKKFGKKNLVIFSNVAIAAVSGLMIFFVSVPYVLLVFSFLAIVFNSVQVVTAPAMVAQYYDYQQFKTGNRLEGFMSQFSAMITSFFAIFTALVGPAISAYFGYQNNKEILYDQNVISNIIRVNLIVGAASSLLGAIPYFFWNLTEKKHRQIMDVLAIRAKCEDGEIPEADEKVLEDRILAGEIDVIKDYFHKTEDELLAEAGDNAVSVPIAEFSQSISNAEQIIEPVNSETSEQIDTPNGGVNEDFAKFVEAKEKDETDSDSEK